MIRTLIVDDEPHARSWLRQLLADAGDIEIIGEAVDGMEALEKIRLQTPALLFLDVQMPGLSGMDLVKEIQNGTVPYLIFTTAYSNYAPEAFDLDAVDYLLKPFDQSRLDRALERARQRLQAGISATSDLGWAHLQQELGRLTRRMDGGDTSASLIVHVGNRLRFLDPSKVRYIEAHGNYVRIVGEGEPFLARERLTDLEQRLQTNRFLRIHRSVLINLAWLHELRAHEQGGYEFLLDSGKKFVSSIGYRQQIRKAVDVEQYQKRPQR